MEPETKINSEAAPVERYPMINGAINAIMKEVGAINKDRKNVQQGFAYRGIDDAMNALHHLFAKHGVFVTTEVLTQEREERKTKSGAALIYSILKCRFTFHALDGSKLYSDIIGEGMDSGDKASNKSLSVALKYALFQLFLIPTEEFIDPDAKPPLPELEPLPPGSFTPVGRMEPIPGSKADKKEKARGWKAAVCHLGTKGGKVNGKQLGTLNEKSVEWIREQLAKIPPASLTQADNLLIAALAMRDAELMPATQTELGQAHPNLDALTEKAKEGKVEIEVLLKVAQKVHSSKATDFFDIEEDIAGYMIGNWPDTLDLVRDELDNMP